MLRIAVPFFIGFVFLFGCKDRANTTQPELPNDCRITSHGKELGASLGAIPGTAEHRFECSFEFYFEDGVKRNYTDVVDTACNHSRFARYSVGDVIPNCKESTTLNVLDDNSVVKL
jgi:hypothetical protein